MRLITQIKKNELNTNIVKDIVSGIIVALVSIPISMGYAQIAGLPPVYGLYGSLFPILIYAFLTTTGQFVVGVDAMPAAMIGGLLAELGIAAGSEEALSIVPLSAFLVALWLLVFYFFKAGRVVKYISSPVMGGFISGVGLTIILMQIPKLFGGNAGTGELIVLIENIISEVSEFNAVSAALGFGTVIIILVFKRINKKIPMTVIMMGVGALLTAVFHIEKYGVKLLPTVAGGFPRLVIPDVSLLLTHTQDLLMETLSVALVIMAQTLLASNNYAMKYNCKIDNNKELLAYSAMNIASGAVGCCPVNGSVSRTGIADQFGCKSQIMSVASAVTMAIILLFATPLLAYLPVPVLTGIVLTALIGIIDIPLAKKLWKTERREFIVFITAFAGVMLFGTVNGVVIGVVLSFAQVVMNAVVPPTAFEGRIPGRGNYYTLGRNKLAIPIKGAVIYRFSGNLFFANIDKFQSDIENSITDETTVIVVDGRGIGHIDFTAAERLIIIRDSLARKNIRFFLTEHSGVVNDQLRQCGAGCLITDGNVRRTITLALRESGLHKPYILADGQSEERPATQYIEKSEQLAEFEWAFGKEAENMLETLANQVIDDVVSTDHVDAIDDKGLHTAWGHIGLFDENEFLERMELRLEEHKASGKMSLEHIEKIEKQIEARRIIAEAKLRDLNPKALELLAEHRKEMQKHMKELHPHEFSRVEALHKKFYINLKKTNPELAEKLKSLYED